MNERLQKVLALAGLGSRREMEKWISAGRVSVDGKVAELGAKVSAKQVVRVDGKILNTKKVFEPTPRVIVYNKPEGEICSNADPEGRPSVFDRLPKLSSGKWIMVGRLDINTTGLLIFTTDGELAHRLMHPSFEIVREYAVRVFGEIPDNIIETLQHGVLLDDGPARFEHVRAAGGEGINKWFNVTLKEGRNREVRRLWESQGLKVSRLMRIKYGEMHIPKGLRVGIWQELDGKAINELRKSVDLKALKFKTTKEDEVKQKRQRNKNNFRR